MTTALHCHSCGHRFGRRGRIAVILGAALCSSCATSEHAHAELFPTCRTAHTPLAHVSLLGVANAFIGRGRATQALNSN